MIATDSQLAELLPQLQKVDRVAVDTEADSLHCYFEKLCLLQLSFSGRDFLIDPFAPVDLQGLCATLATKEIVLQGADFDLRLLRRSLQFVPQRIFDTVIAARLLGMREFSLASLVQRFFGVALAKGSQKANWAQRPLSDAMAKYAMNDTHYLLPLAEKLEEELKTRGRLTWFRQSCQRALEQASVQRVRDPEDAWRVAGSGALSGKSAAVLKALWHWREREARDADRPPFHILQNSLLLSAAESFAAGDTPDFRYFSSHRRRAFQAAAREALRLPEAEWPQPRPRTGTRPSRAVVRKTEDLKQRRDRAATELEIEPSFISPRSILESIAADEGRSAELLVPWQRKILNV